MYFITIRHLLHKDRLQKAIQESVKNYKHVLTEKTFEELEEHFKAQLDKLSKEHTRCIPIRLTKCRFDPSLESYKGTSDTTDTSSISLGEETILFFTRVQGKVESNFNVQTEIPHE